MANQEANKARLRDLIRELRDEAGLSYEQLAERLKAHGVVVSPRVLNNRINRGNFSAGFALTLLQVFGVKTLQLTDPPARLRVSKDGTRA